MQRVFLVVIGLVVGVLVGIPIGKRSAAPPLTTAVPTVTTTTATATTATTTQDHLTRLLAIRPKEDKPEGSSFELLVEVGNRDMDEQKFAQAIRSYERALTLRDDPRVLTDLGVCYRNIGNSAKALAAFDRALKIDPNVWEADYNRAVLFAGEGRLEEARAIARKLRERHPGNSDVIALDDTLSKSR